MLAKPNNYVFHIKCIYDNTKSFIFIQLSFEIQQLIWCLRIFFKDLCPWFYIETYTYSSTGPGITYFCQLWFYYCIHRSSPDGIHILLFIKIVQELTLLSSLRRMSFKTLFVRGLAISPILYRLYKKLQVNLKWNRKVFYTFLIFRLETWWVVSPLTKYDVMSKAKWLFAHFT